MKRQRTIGARDRAVAGALSLVFLIAACGDDSGTNPPPQPTQGGIEVTVTTMGDDTDPDGYTLSANGGAPVNVDPASTTVLGPLSAGSVTITLGGVAENCQADATERTVTVVAGDTVSTSFAVLCSAVVGSVDIITETGGASIDPDGYMVSLDGGAPTPIGVNDTVSITGLAPGTYSVALTDAASNCEVGQNPRDVSVVADQTTETLFQITCSATTGTIVVDTETTGQGQDPDGYTIIADGTNQLLFAANDSQTLSDLPPGDYSFELDTSTVASNCNLVAGQENPVTVSVAAGGTEQAAFAVNCLTNRIIFESDATGNWDILQMDVDGSNVVNLTNSAGVDERLPDVNPVDGRIVYWNASSNDVWVMNPDGSGARALISDVAQEFAPEWSPDGAMIAYVRKAGSGSRRIAIIDSVGTVGGATPSFLTDNGGNDDSPSWAPDASQIAFASDRTGTDQIWLVNVSSTTIVQITNGSTTLNAQPSWRPDGSRIVFFSDRNGPGDVYEVDTDGSNEVQITTHPGSDFSPQYSPDGMRITFVSNRDVILGQVYEVWTMNPDGSEKRQLTSLDGQNEEPTWTP